jgi:hypothetical protein
MIPNLIHPVPVTIQRMEPNATLLDPVAREPVRQMWRNDCGPGTLAPLQLEAQVNWNDGEMARPTFPAGGAEEEWKGYLVFRVVDLVAAGVAVENPDGTLQISLARGDRIVRIGRRVVDLYVLWFRDIAAYPDQGGATLLEVTFNDRLAA